MARGFGTLLDDGPPTDTTLPPCQAAGCGAPAGFKRRDLRSRVDAPIYLEAWCGEHVPASFMPERRR